MSQTNDSAPTSTQDEWPEMAEMEFGADRLAVPGSYAASVVSLGATGRHGRPMPMVQSAGCAYCNRWAVEFHVGTRIDADGDLFNSVHRRMSMELIYVCDQHGDTAIDELLDKEGSCSNRLDLDLALEVEKRSRGAR